MPTVDDNVNPAAIALVASVLAGPPPGEVEMEDGLRIIEDANRILAGLTSQERLYLPIIMANHLAQLLRTVSDNDPAGRSAQELLQEAALRSAAQEF